MFQFTRYNWRAEPTLRLGSTQTEIIESPEPTIKIKITDFNTEADCDKVTVWDDNGHYWLEDYSGNSIPTPDEYTFNSTKVYVSFRTDGGGVRNGWHLEYSTFSRIDISEEICI